MVDVTVASVPAAVSGRWLVEQRGLLERGELCWLEALGRFDASGLWGRDGACSTAAWLVAHARMGRSTAHDKVRVARALRDRPVLAEAFGGGRISYCALRAISRLRDPSAETDAALVDLAESAGVATLERAVRYYELCAEGDRPPPERDERRAVELSRGCWGLGRAVAVLGDSEIDELDAALGAFMPGPDMAVGESSRGDSDGASNRPDMAVGESSRGDRIGSARQRRADALMAMVRAAVASLAGGRPGGGGDERYLVHVVFGADGRAETLAGMPVHAGTAARVACDAQVVAHRFDPEGGGPLSQGRRVRVWSAAQRRAIRLRDGGGCRFPGCANRQVDAHHLRPWWAGGPTDVSNGLSLCPRHHTLVHDGWAITGEPAATLTFVRPDGQAIGTSQPTRV